MLLQQMKAEEVPLGLVTYLSCDIESQRIVLEENPASPMYFTGSREVAAAIKEVTPKLIASTGGPNTMVATHMNEGVSEATRMSTLIENSGQCTAMRHLVVPECSIDDVMEKVFASVPTVKSSSDALATGEFAALIEGHPTSAGSDEAVAEGYVMHPKLPISAKVSVDFPNDIEEKWRQGFLDVTSVGADFGSPQMIRKLGMWLNKHQPISLAVNGSYDLALKLWECSGMVVNTAGDGAPGAGMALTAQARPQDGEVFGEFPPRRELTNYTQFPAIVPSATAGYNSSLTTQLLASHVDDCPSDLAAIIGDQAAGYCGCIASYLRASCGAHPGKATASRTSLYGLQRPPLGMGPSILRLEPTTTADDAAPYLLLFLMTNAREDFALSVAPGAQVLMETLLAGIPQLADVHCTEEDAADLDTRAEKISAFNVIVPSAFGRGSPSHPLPAHFVSLMFPVGHVKSTVSSDTAFLEAFSASEKWLRVVE